MHSPQREGGKSSRWSSGLVVAYGSFPKACVRDGDMGSGGRGRRQTSIPLARDVRTTHQGIPNSIMEIPSLSDRQSLESDGQRSIIDENRFRNEAPSPPFHRTSGKNEEGLL